jgi:hypothetical protein
MTILPGFVLGLEPRTSKTSPRLMSSFIMKQEEFTLVLLYEKMGM